MRARRARVPSCVLVALAGAACAGRPAPEAYTRGRVDVACCGHSDEMVEVTFLGVAGWLIRRGGEAVLTAPLFSNPTLTEAGLEPIAADPDRIAAHLPDVSDVVAVLVGHGHYDHLMDVPEVLPEVRAGALVLTNATAAYQLAPFRVARDVRVIEDHELGDVEGPGAWIPVGERIRVMGLRSSHAPHLAGITLYGGVRGRPMERRPESASEWLAGETIAFLIDFLNRDGSLGLRVYFQDAVAAPPYGLVPRVDDGLPVDVAMIVPATYAEVDWHPEALIESARPRHVLLGHWEDFFRAPSREPRPVPFTRLPEFLARLSRALGTDDRWSLPLPGSRFRFD